MPTLADAPSYGAAVQHAAEMKATHLTTLLSSDDRNSQLAAEFQGIFLDYCRQKVAPETMRLLLQLAEEMGLANKIKAMFAGQKINVTENRAVLHVALRARPDQVIEVDGKNVVPEVHAVLSRMKKFAHQIRTGEWVGYTGKPLKDVICIGIGGSYLGPEFVYEGLRTDPEAHTASHGRRLRFLANVDPIDVKRALEGFHAETTLIIIISKTFTTAETMLNARTIKEWLLRSLHNEAAVSRHMVAVSTNISETSAFGINPDNVFGFWDWVGGRFSVCSAVGILPLAVHFGWQVISQFLQGANAMDDHFKTAAFSENLPVLMGLVSVWNASFLDYPCHAILPYCQALIRFAAHIQQVTMESNGKRVSIDCIELPYQCGEIDFGEPGTNGQHSFYQLLHQGRTVPADFIGFCRSQNPVIVANDPVPNHDELMSNFFAQPDALAFGKSADLVAAEGVPPELVPHKTFPGDKPSLSLLFPEANAYYLGCLLALYEHRTAVQGFMWSINSFDQWGVELGKVLAKEIRKYLAAKRKDLPAEEEKLPAATRRLLGVYLSQA